MAWHESQADMGNDEVVEASPNPACTRPRYRARKWRLHALSAGLVAGEVSRSRAAGDVYRLIGLPIIATLWMIGSKER